MQIKKEMIRPGTLLRYKALKGLMGQEIKGSFVVFDIGGFDGFLSYQLRRMFPNLDITLVDTDRSGLDIAQKRGLKTLHASALDLPIEDNSADIVICLDVIEHIEEDDKLVSEISRVLKKDGKVILTTPMQNGIPFPFLSNNKIDAINRNWGHIRKGYSLNSIENMFRINNLVIEETNKYFNLFSRFFYWLCYIYGIPLRGKDLLYQAIITLEPYIKYRAKTHVIIGRKA